MSAYLSARAVIQAVAAVTRISPGQIVGRARQHQLTEARHIAMYFTGIYSPHLSLPQVGRIFGGRDHTTVLHARHKVAERVKRLGLDLQMREIKEALDLALSIFARIEVNDIPDADPLVIAERAMTDHEVSRITYDEIRVMGAFVINIVENEKLISEGAAPPNAAKEPPPLCDEPPSPVEPIEISDDLISAARRVILAHSELETARFGRGELSAAELLGEAIKGLRIAYADLVGVIPTRTVFTSPSNAPRKEAHDG